MLKILLCHPQRRMSKARLVETIWPVPTNINTTHALDTAASVLRRHILCTYDNTSLLYTQRVGKDTIFKLPGQAYLWVDADELMILANQAIQAEERGENPCPYLEKAHSLATGDFLEDEWYTSWSQARRQMIDGARRRILHHLTDIYLQEQRTRHAEELLFTFLQQYPTDEDALCRLMRLLTEQGRSQEALHIYRYTAETLRENCHEPAHTTKELARHIQHGLTIHDQVTVYSSTQPGQFKRTIISVA
jgi:DNA-binding SARP family transcriptional activator